jgi:hypothetical protein
MHPFSMTVCGKIVLSSVAHYHKPMKPIYVNCFSVDNIPMKINASLVAFFIPHHELQADIGESHDPETVKVDVHYGNESSVTVKFDEAAFKAFDKLTSEK